MVNILNAKDLENALGNQEVVVGAEKISFIIRDTEFRDFLVFLGYNPDKDTLMGVQNQIGMDGIKQRLQVRLNEIADEVVRGKGNYVDFIGALHQHRINDTMTGLERVARQPKKQEARPQVLQSKAPQQQAPQQQVLQPQVLQPQAPQKQVPQQHPVILDKKQAKREEAERKKQERRDRKQEKREEKIRKKQEKKEAEARKKQEKKERKQEQKEIETRKKQQRLQAPERRVVRERDDHNKPVERINHEIVAEPWEVTLDGTPCIVRTEAGKNCLLASLNGLPVIPGAYYPAVHVETNSDIRVIQQQIDIRDQATLRESVLQPLLREFNCVVGAFRQLPQQVGAAQAPYGNALQFPQVRAVQAPYGNALQFPQVGAVQAPYGNALQFPQVGGAAQTQHGHALQFPQVGAAQVQHGNEARAVAPWHVTIAGAPCIIKTDAAKKYLAGMLNITLEKEGAVAPTPVSKDSDSRVIQQQIDIRDEFEFGRDVLTPLKEEHNCIVGGLPPGPQGGWRGQYVTALQGGQTAHGTRR